MNPGTGPRNSGAGRPNFGSAAVLFVRADRQGNAEDATCEGGQSHYYPIPGLLLCLLSQPFFFNLRVFIKE